MLPSSTNRVRPQAAQSAAALGSTDAELLQQFVSRRDLAAFEVLLRRHGPMVYQVCQRILHHPADAEDAFQATFVVLVKKASTIAQPDLVGGWLHGVAQRIAMKARSRSAQRQARERPLAEPVTGPGQPTGESTWREVSPILDEELNRLPDKYRTPLVLCYLEGKTNDQAAEQLGWSRGQVAGQLSRGRDLLRKRLTSRGLTMTSAALGTLLIQQSATAAVPAALVSTAVQTAGGQAALVSAQALALAEDVSLGSAGFTAKVVVGAVVAMVALAGGLAFVLQESKPPAALVFQNFDAATVPTNRAGQQYPHSYEPDHGGQFIASIQPADAVAGQCLQLRLLDGWLKAQFDPSERRGRGFARDFALQHAAWTFNTYNRFRFWVKLPPDARPYPTNGRPNMGFGAYVKRVHGADPFDPLDAGGNCFFHLFTAPATGQWTQVVLNMHPNWNVEPADRDIGNQSHPTGETEYNYFDAMTRFYLEARFEPARYPADYFLDEMEFYHEAAPENDEQVYSITATHVPEQQRVILTWCRRIGEDQLPHEVRYAFESIHQIGWEAAQPAPGGRIKPPGMGEFSGMVYDSSALPLQGRATLYLAIKPEKAKLFSQVAIRLTRQQER